MLTKKEDGETSRRERSLPFQAFDYRYRNEGKKKKKLAASGGTPAAIPQRPTNDRWRVYYSETNSNSTIKTTKAAADFKHCQTSGSSIDESGDETVVKLDKNREGYEDLMTKLRMWQID